MKTIWKAMLYAALLTAFHISFASVQAPQNGAAAASRAIGTVQSISGANFTLKTDAGVTVSVSVQDSAKVLRIEPGQTSLTGAVPIYLTDIQVGDRVLASGSAGSSQGSLLATTVVAIKKADVESKQQQDLQDWQRRGTGGLVAAVDPAAGTVSLKVNAAGASKTVMVHTSKTTQVLRYAADSVKFDDAKPSTLEAIKPGDQLLARGTRSTDGNDVTADAVVSGAFHNLSGVLTSVTPAENVLTLKDVATKMAFTVKITPDSQLRKLTAQAAAMLATRMKASNAGAVPAANAAAANSGGRAGGRFGGGAAGGDLSQVIARAPTITMADLQKGDAVMIVATAGTGSGPVSAIQLVAGVEPILEASPSASMNLPAWNVGGGDAGGSE